MELTDNINSPKKYTHIFKYTLITAIFTFLVHMIMVFIVRQALKIAVFSEAIGIAVALAVVCIIMFTAYFIGRKLITDKKLIPRTLYYVISAVFPVIIWSIIAVAAFVSASAAIHFNMEMDINAWANTVKSTLKVINSIIGLLSSLMVFLSAGLCEIISMIVKNLKKV